MCNKFCFIGNWYTTSFQYKLNLYLGCHAKTKCLSCYDHTIVNDCDNIFKTTTTIESTLFTVSLLLVIRDTFNTMCQLKPKCLSNVVFIGQMNELQHSNSKGAKRMHLYNSRIIGLDGTHIELVRFPERK